MGTIIRVLIKGVTRARSGGRDTVLGEHLDGADDLHYELLRGLV